MISQTCLRRRAAAATRPFALLALLFAVAGCERINRIGQPPSMSPVGQTGASANVVPARVAVATPDPYNPTA